MKPSSLVPTLLALGLALGSTMVLAPGCGGEAATTGTTGSGGSGGGSTTSTGGTTTTTTTTADNAQCQMLCSHLNEIDCNILPNCEVDCANHLNAPDGCAEAADELIACWVKNLDDFTCTMQQVLPPAMCKDQETAFNTCVKGGGAPDASCICSVGVGVGDGMVNCSRKTTCATLEYVQTCQKLNAGEPWTCSCFANGGLLGTCSEQDEFTHCDNQYGCCVPLFCAASGE
jgi:hypothetical protein